MIFMSSNPLDAYKEIDPKIVEQYQNLAGLTYSDGALSAKFKLLIAMTIDVENGALEGAVILGKRAQKMGATKEEIIEALSCLPNWGHPRDLYICSIDKSLILIELNPHLHSAFSSFYLLIRTNKT